MPSTAATPDEYIEQLPADRKQAMNELRKEIKKNLPKGFAEEMSYGMIGYVVPLSLYPAGYHCNPKLPLPYMNIASQKSSIVIHHIGMYADKKLSDWFTKEYAAQSTAKLDMGKGCVRFKKPEQIPYKLIGQLVKKFTPQEWIKHYEEIIKR